MRGPVMLWMATIVIGVVLKKLSHRRKEHQSVLKLHRKHSSETWNLGQRPIQFAPETKFREIKPGPKTQSSAEILSQKLMMVRYWIMMSWKMVMSQCNSTMQVDDSRTRPIIFHDMVFCSLSTKPQKMMLRHQSTTINSDQLCNRRQ